MNKKKGDIIFSNKISLIELEEATLDSPS